MNQRGVFEYRLTDVTGRGVIDSWRGGCYQPRLIDAVFEHAYRAETKPTNQSLRLVTPRFEPVGSAVDGWSSVNIFLSKASQDEKGGRASRE